MKKFISLLISILMILSTVSLLTACNGEKDKQLSDALSELSKLKNSSSNFTSEETNESSLSTSNTEAQSSISSSSQISEVSKVSEASTQSTESKSRFFSVYSDNYNKYKTLVETYKPKFEEICKKAGSSYSSYISNQSDVMALFDNLESDYSQLFEETNTVTEKYMETVKAQMSGSKYNDWDKELDYFYDDIYDGVLDDIYDDVYDGLLDDIFDKIYDEGLYDMPDNVEYKDWSKARSEFYKKWSKARSTFYKKWSNIRSDVYSAWTDTRSDLYKL